MPFAAFNRAGDHRGFNGAGQLRVARDVSALRQKLKIAAHPFGQAPPRLGRTSRQIATARTQLVRQKRFKPFDIGGQCGRIDHVIPLTDFRSAEKALVTGKVPRYPFFMLNTVVHGTPTDKPPLLIVHGLYGSARNWGVIAKRLSDERQVVAVDQRNHGNSFRADQHGYHDMAGDLAEVIDAHGGQMDVMGHSMGGKAAMVLALTHPEKVGRLVVADIAPVAYSHDQTRYINAMKSIDLDKVARRSDAVEQLAKLVPEKTLQSFFTQSLDVANKRWLLNLDVLGAEMPNIIGWPGTTGEFPRPTLFLTGSESDYVLPEHRAHIRELFPRARFAKIPGTGHWLHAEKPREFEASVRTFLNYDFGD